MRLVYRRLMTALILFPWMAAWLATPGTVQAAGIVVTTTQDEVPSNNGNCTLREAVKAASTRQKVDLCDGRGGNTDIILQPGQVYTLSIKSKIGANQVVVDTPDDGDLDIRGGMMLFGDSQNKAVIDATGLGDRVLHINASAPVTLYGVEIRGGEVTTAPLRGGGVYVEAGVVNMQWVTVTGNASSRVGGGIFAADGTTVSVYNTMITGNRAVQGGGVYSYGSFSMTASSLMDNMAVAFPNQGDIDTIGAGLVNNGWNGAAATLVNTTVARNRNTEGSNQSAGIYSAARLVLENVTIIDNEGTGLEFTGTLVTISSIVKNTIIARQQGANCTMPVGNQVALQGRFNLADDGSCGLLAPNDVVLAETSDSKISLTAEFLGSQTLMYELLEESPALNAGRICQGLDQRGMVRPANCDIGSYERDASSPFFIQLPAISR